jgi:hypothetical protein
VKFAAVRVQVAGGPTVYLRGRANQHLPGDKWFSNLTPPESGPLYTRIESGVFAQSISLKKDPDAMD